MEMYQLNNNIFQFIQISTYYHANCNNLKQNKIVILIIYLRFFFIKSMKKIKLVHIFFLREGKNNQGCHVAGCAVATLLKFFQFAC